MVLCEGKGCRPPSWNDFQVIVFICVGGWMGLLVLGLIAAAMRHQWDVERVSMWLQPFALFVKEDKYYLAVMATLSSIMCAFNVLYVENDDVFDWGNTLETVACYIHTVEVLILFVFNCSQSQDDIFRFATTRLFTDCMIIISVLTRGQVKSSYFSFSFFSASRLQVLWLQFEDTLSPLDKGFSVKCFHEAIIMFSKIFVFASMIRELESFTGDPWMHQKWKSWEEASHPEEVWTTSSSIYVVLCTLTTVGYGDVTPRTILGQTMLMVIILTGLGFSAYTVIGLMETAQHAQSGGGEYRIHSARRMRRHVVVAGNPSSQMIQDLLEELYHDDHWETAQSLDCVLLMPPGSEGIRARVHHFLHQKQNRRICGKVWSLQGSPLNNRDLERCSFGSASLGYILPNVHAADSEREDIENAMRALSMHRFAPYVRLVSMLIKVHFKEMMLSVGLSNKDIICIDEIKMGIVGKSCVAQGFVVMVCNLFKSAGEYDEGTEGEAWMADYKRGMGNEIYEIRLSASYRGAPFGEVAIDILNRSESKAYMIGVIDESRYPGEEPTIRMHPGRHYRLGLNEDYVLKGIFIAPDGECIQQHPADKPFSWHIETGSSDGLVAVHEAIYTNKLPGQVNDKKDILAEMAQRWIIDHKALKRQYKASTRDAMATAAETRTVQGLKNLAHMDRPEVEEIMDKPVEKEAWIGRSFLAAEDGFEASSDPKERALQEQEMKAAKEQEKEKQKSMAEKRTTAEIRLRKMTEKIAARADADIRVWDDPNAAAEQEMDNELWGGPRSPRKPLWGDPLEPPPSLLIRGEHIIMIALEGNEDTIVTESSMVEAAGRKLGLEHFMRSLRADVPQYAQRAVVVLSQRVPYDWPKVTAMFKDVYLVTGRPLAEENLMLSGLRYAQAVIVYQRGPVTTHDPTLVDAQAIFGTALTETLLRYERKDMLCLVDLNLDDNAYFCTLDDQESVDGFIPDEVSMKEARRILEKVHTPYVDTKRYVSGQMFASGQSLTSLVANMLYNPALGSLVLEMLECRYVVIPVPMEFTGKTYQELYEFMMRKKNLVVVALLRNFAEATEDGQDEEVDKEDTGPVVVIDEAGPEKRYTTKDPPYDRFIYTMPIGDRPILVSDGVMCIVPKGDSLSFQG